MDKNNELVNILRAELTLLTKDILQNIHQKDLKSLYKATRQLQEKMAAIMVLKEQLDTDELIKILKMKEPESPVEKQPEPIKEEVKISKNEKKEAKPVDNPYKNINKMSFVPKNEAHKNSKQPINTATHHKKINIGLNDRISFIKHLFDGDNEFYANFIDRLNAFDSYEAALRYINQEIKPEFNHWEGKDEYEFRLLQLLELKFS